MGGDPRGALLLVGMGMRRLSMSPRRIPEVKTCLRRSAAADLVELAERCMGFSTAGEVQQHVESFFESVAMVPSEAV